MERLADYYKIMPSERQVLITRLYQAPRTLVYKAWSKPEALALWYAPYGCTVQFERLDFKVGGDFLARLHDPKSGDSWTTGTYLEIQAPERLSYTRTTCENEGTPIDPAGGGGGGSGINTEWPQTTTVTTTFEERHGKTKVTLHQTVREELALRTGAHSNWQQMLDRLAKNLRQIN
ncbi:MAG: SRPBCC domain-containing protein [Bdellovibrio sp.]